MQDGKGKGNGRWCMEGWGRADSAVMSGHAREELWGAVWPGAPS